MQKSSKKRSSTSRVIPAHLRRKFYEKDVKKSGNIKDTNILAFIQTFKPLNVSTNALNVKKRHPNISQKIIKNMRENFDSLPPIYLKKRRMEKLNSQGREQRNKYRNFLEIFREDTENNPPLPQLVLSNREYGQFVNSTDSHVYAIKQTNNIYPIEGEMDSLLKQELSFHGDSISSTMEELYSIASGTRNTVSNQPNITQIVYPSYIPYYTW